MPGPSNGRKKRKSRGKEQKKKKTVSSFQPSLDASIDSNHKTSNSSDSSSSPPVHAPISHVRDEQSIHPVSFQAVEQAHDIYEPPLACTEDDYSHILLQKPFIYNPGNGPRVTNMRGFLASRFFSQPPALENPLCAEFAQDAVLEMIKTVLPEELALVRVFKLVSIPELIHVTCFRSSGITRVELQVGYVLHVKGYITSQTCCLTTQS